MDWDYSDLFEPKRLTCAECLDLLDIAAEIILSGHSLDEALPGVARHLATCALCRAELESLLAVLRAGQDAGRPEPRPLASSLPSRQVEFIVPVHRLSPRRSAIDMAAHSRSAGSSPGPILLLLEAVETPWGPAGLQVVAWPAPEAGRLDVHVDIAFDQPPSESLDVELRWADQSQRLALDEHGRAVFPGIAAESLFSADPDCTPHTMTCTVSPRTASAAE